MALPSKRKLLVASLGVVAAAYGCGNGNRTVGNDMLYPQDASDLDTGAQLDAAPTDTTPAFDVSRADVNDASVDARPDVDAAEDGGG